MNVSFPAYDENYFKQLTAEKVRTQFIKGFPVREWYKDEGVRNDALDRRVYNMCVLHARTVPREILARSAPTEPPPVSPSPVPGEGRGEGEKPHTPSPAPEAKKTTPAPRRIRVRIK
jgi:phage terminase large subunit GpA-like protein